VKKLWDSMEDGAYILNRAEGFFADEAKVHFINHQGPQFSVRGPLNVIRPPQGYPVIVQAGSSDQGIAFAGAAAEVVFTAQHSIDGARAFYAAIKSAATASGRRESDILVMPGISLYVGDTKEAAERQREHLDSLIPSALGIHALSDLFGVDFSRYRLDDPLPTDLPATNRMIARANLMRETAARHNLTIRQVYQRLLGASGHLTVCGTVSEIADVMEEWFTTGAADGFNVSQPTVPEGIDDFVGLVIPELRRRGLVSSEYAGSMLRENLGLARPPNQYAS
jgi:alkanesulfonate monooxygenase